MVVESHGKTGRVFEYCIHALEKKRLPVFHAVIAAAFADRGIEWIVIAHHSKNLPIMAAKARDGFIIEKKLGSGKQAEGFKLSLGTLRCGVEAPDGFDLVAEQIKTQRL